MMRQEESIELAELNKRDLKLHGENIDFRILRDVT